MSARKTIELPDIGDYKDVPVVEILVAVGDSVGVDQPIITLESDKATLEVPSPSAGRIVEFLVDIGSKVSTGMAVAIVEVDEAAVTCAPSAPIGESLSEPVPARETAAATSPQEPAEAMISAAQPLEGREESRTAHATPSVRTYARELGVDLSRVSASGPKGRILREDVQGFVKSRLSAPDNGSTQTSSGLSLAAMPAIDFSKYGEIEREPLSRIQQISGANLHRNWLTIPHVTNFDNADVTDLEAFRLAINAERRNPPVKLTMVAFLIKASALALAAFPRFNSSLDGVNLIKKKYVHVGFAVDTPKGLMVPVIRDCDRKGLIQIADEMASLSEKARQGKLAPSDMEGGSFSVSSLGGIGGAGFTPIINAPEVAILGAARSQTQAVWNGSTFEPRLVTPISLSWDHRVVDGVAAARFLGHVAGLLVDFRRALL
ncbi:dihydrolipoyllysine-residue acetyltransferase [Mesorhizobium caraganae]|uniref:dihydrolipoyllysine-residue acetyltransferase n=1 Tax=Mesorhizobium caraganae TaxID=483206 RepID=UPI0017851D4E|nr:dihydrolipoyllysine-residue acetyltransferase [Mesorhizobium caraganae]MBM2712947.1 dihydrolipoyllysine-residue acetyltransferase [Mesorhizobium caraganae]